jgi:saccharopine dehydrogenase-like NADP-dependent oxidoreductase
MKRILLLGAGRSASTLIDYLLRQAPLHDWHLTIGDVTVAHLQARLQAEPRATALVFDVHDRQQGLREVRQADLVISMLPAAFHRLVAEMCLEEGRHLITASYATPDLQALGEQARQKGLTFLMEVGLDPGIDHMSAMAMLQRLRERGARLLAFRSYTGGLVAPESDTNPWHYKFTWNPRNVVLAGQGGARFLEGGRAKFIPYHQLFRRTEPLQVAGLGAFDGYANRDSLSYRAPYGLQEVPTLLRGTLRRQGFCQAWHLLVQLGLTDDSFQIPDARELTYRQFLEAFLPAPEQEQHQEEPLPVRVARYLQVAPDSPEMALLGWLGLWEDAPIGLTEGSPARILEHLLTQKWQLAPDDKDMIVMQHLFDYTLDGETRRLKATMVVQGDDAVHTAMAKTVGLPVGMAARLLLQGKVSRTGVVIPIYPELYEPILAELQTYGIDFGEEEGVM